MARKLASQLYTLLDNLYYVHHEDFRPPAEVYLPQEIGVEALQGMGEAHSGGIVLQEDHHPGDPPPDEEAQDARRQEEDLDLPEGEEEVVAQARIPVLQVRERVAVKKYSKWIFLLILFVFLRVR